MSDITTEPDEARKLAMSLREEWGQAGIQHETIIYSVIHWSR
jgi:hypothetical protein